MLLKGRLEISLPPFVQRNVDALKCLLMADSRM